MHEQKLHKLVNDLQEILTGIPSHGETPQSEELSREDLLADLQERIGTCRLCSLCEGRTCTVPGYGPLDAKVMVIGEGPGAEEDRQGLPFVGAAGQYLDKWFSAIGLTRGEHLFIGNVVKCRPPGNRDPLPEEISSCMPYLKQQIEIIRPKVLLTVGRISAQALLETGDGIGRLRGRVYDFCGIPLVPTYHPSGVLRNPEYRRPVWEDLKLLKSLLDRDQS